MEKKIKSIDELPQGYNLFIEENKNSPIYSQGKLNKGILFYNKINNSSNSNDGDNFFVLTLDTLKSDAVISVITKFKNFYDVTYGKKIKIIQTSATSDLINEIILRHENNEVLKNTSDDGNDLQNQNDVNEKILLKSKQLKASDIHIEKRQDKTLLRMRINGEIVVIDKFSAQKGSNYASIIYQSYTANGNGEADVTFDDKKNQTGLLNITINQEKIRLRIQSFKTVNGGFDLICRLLPTEQTTTAIPLEKLGYEKKEKTDIEAMLSKPDGVIIVSGVTGSGKSTTLTNIILDYLNNHDVKCITIEDPVEADLPASQMSFNREKTKNVQDAYEEATNAMLRSDPDILFFGETRDVLGANALVKGALTGHLTLTTLHASSWLGTITRLREIGINSKLLGTPKFIAGIVYQRLLPVLCPHCSQKLEKETIPSFYTYEKILNENYDIYGIGYDTLINLKANKPNNRTLVRYLQDIGELDSEKANLLFKTYKEKNDLNYNKKLLKRIKKVCDINFAEIRFRGSGCNQCTNGIVTRSVCAETIVPDEKICELISNGQDVEAVNYWRTYLNGRTAFEDAIEKMKKGFFDPNDVEFYFDKLGNK